jgi:hypothetical protein
MAGVAPRSTRSRLGLIALVGALSLTAGCRTGPTLEEAEELLRAGDAEAALDVARRASARGTPAERIASRRLALQAALAAGLSRDAAREYQLLRRLTGREDDGLLAELAGAALRRAITADDRARRLRGVAALRVLGDDPRALALLRTALTDGGEDVRAAAVTVLADLPDRAVAERELIVVAGRDPSSHVRRRALESLAALPAAPDRDAALAAALAALEGEADQAEGQDVRVAAVRLLARVASPERARALLAAIVERSDEPARHEAALELLRLDPPAARRAWTAAKLPTDTPLGLALLLHERKDTAAVAALRDLLLGRDAPYERRLLAARGLAGPAAAHLAATLQTVALEDPVQAVRAAALDALVAGATADDARRACARALRHVDPATRRRARDGLERLAALSPDDAVRHLSDAALADAACAWLAANAGEQGHLALLSALGHPVAGPPALEALADRGDRRLRERFVALLTLPELDRAGPRAWRAAALGLARCGEARDRALLVALLDRPGADHADLAAASALLALQTRLARVAPVGSTPE